MKKYKTFYIGGQKWTAYLVSPKSKHLVVDGEQKVGTCFHSKCRIYIANDQSPEAREEVFLHEVFHAIFYVSGAGKVFADDKAEEDFILGIMPVAHRLLKDLGFRLSPACTS